MHDGIGRRHASASSLTNGSSTSSESVDKPSEHEQCHHALGICSKMVYSMQNIILKPSSWPKLKGIKLKNEKAPPGCAYVPTEIEHIFNAFTHGLFILPAFYAALQLFIRSQTTNQKIVALIYGNALVMLFIVSTFFHCVFYCDRNKSLKVLLHRADRAMIYIFIAGSYFPWLNLGHATHPLIVTVLNWFIWILAAIGILYQQIYHEKYKLLETCFYLVMAVGPTIAISFCNYNFNEPDMTCEHEHIWRTELKLGGILYLIGVFFFKADGKIPFAHAIWHIFVVLAAFVHYFAILSHLFPAQQLETLS